MPGGRPRCRGADTIGGRATYSSSAVAAAARRTEVAGAVRQARAVAVHVAPRLPAGVRASGTAGRAAGGVLARLQPAPEDLVRRGGADRCGQRGRAFGDFA